MPNATRAAAPAVCVETLEPRVLLASDPLLSVGAISSSSVLVGWDPIANATEIRVYVAPEPSATAGNDLPGQVLVDTLSGGATSYAFTDLAAEVDMFFRIEADVPGEEVASNTHARTVGGPNQGTDSRMDDLDTPLREVHGFGPNILELVLAEFEVDVSTDATALINDGEAWQNGTWTITRSDSSDIDVTDVHRRTIPTGEWKYETGYGEKYFATNAVDLDHHIYLVLDENIGSMDVLTIDGPNGLHFVLPFSDEYLETTVIQLNQVGYNPDATERWAYVSGWMGDGGGLDLSGFANTANVLVQPTDAMALRTTAVSNITITQRSAYDDFAGAAVDEIDLSTVPEASGVRYRVQIPGVGVSWTTAVSEEAAFKAYYTAVRGLYYQRWGDDLDSDYTEWSRGESHTSRTGLDDLGENPQQTYAVVYESDTAWTTGTTFFDPATEGRTPFNGDGVIEGGHHDAGDYDLRSYHTLVPQTLMRAYELNASALTDSQADIPQSGNSIPDLLDEALWNIQSWEALQETGGGVRAGVESYRHPLGYYHTDEDLLPYWTYGVDVWTTSKAAGLFAQASRLVAPFDSTRAAELQTEAIAAYTYAKNNSASDQWLLYGASELYAATGQSTYLNDFETYWINIGGTQTGAYSGIGVDQYQNATHLPDHLLGYLTSSGADSSYVALAESITENAADNALNDLYYNHAHRTPGGNGAWGESSALGRHMDNVYSRLQLGGLTAGEQQTYFNAISLCSDFILGGNPMGMSLITGLGSRMPLDPLHLDSLAFVKDGLGVVPGIPVFGVTQATNTSAFYPTALPLYYRYADQATAVANTEFTVTEMMGPHIELFAALLPAGWTAPDSYEPYGAEHHNTLTAFGNQAADVDAGSEQVLSLSGASVQTTLDGSYQDDGVTAGVTTTWSVGSGPASVSFGNANALDSTATFTRGGEYVLHLTADDGSLRSIDTVTVVVNDTDAGTPVVDAGSDQQIVMPDAGVSLDGTVTDGGSTTAKWTVASAPNGGRVTFGDAAAVDTTATFSLPGLYVLRLSADDGSYYAADTVSVVVKAEGTFAWTSENVADANTLVLYHLDETSGTAADNAEGTSARDMTVDDASVWTNLNAWGGDGGHMDAGAHGGAVSGTVIPTDWTDGMTLSFWMRCSTYPQDPQVPIQMYGTATYQNKLAFQWRNDWSQVSASTHNTTANFQWLDPATTLHHSEISDGQWHHYAVVYMGDTTGMARLYVDNVLQDIDGNGNTEWDASAGSVQSTATLLINAFGGEVDEVLLQGEAITNFANGLNAPVTANFDSFSTNEDTQLSANAASGVLANDEDAEDDTLTASLLRDVSYGTLSLASDGSFTYTPNANFSGTDTFTYRATDGANISNVATVTITVNSVNDVPIAAADSYTTDEDFDLVVSAAEGVLANDTDADGESLTAVLVSDVSDGTLSLASDGSFTYQPDADWSGTDSFTYQANDGTANSNAVTVNITVNAIDELYEADFTSDVSSDWSMTNASVVVDTGLQTTSGWGTIGWAELTGDDAIDETDLTIIADFDNGTGNNNSYHEIAARSSGSTGGVYFRIYGGNNNANVELVDGTSTLATQPVNGLRSQYAPMRVTMTLDGSDVSVTVHQVAGTDGTNTWGDVETTFTGTITQTTGSGNIRFAAQSFSNSPTLAEIRVLPVAASSNNAPVATADAYDADQDTQLSVNAANGVLANDTDADSDPLTASLVSDAAHGTLNLSSDGSFTYTPDTGYSGSDSFTYRASDGADYSNTVTVSLDIEAAATGTLYETDFTSDVSSDWSMTNASVVVNTGLQTTSGWGTIGWAELTGDDAVDETNIAVTATFDEGAGNGNSYHEIGGRTSTSSDGVYVRVYGAWNNAVVALYDGATQLSSQTVTGLRSQYAPIQVTLTLDGTSASADIYQAAGSGDGQTWSEVSTTLSGTISTSTGSGNVRFAARSYSNSPVMTAIQVIGSAANTAPVATTDSYQTNEDTQLTVNAANGVLDNDTDADSDPLTAALVSDVSHGTLSLSSDGSFTYTPDADYNGSDSFTYKANDGTDDSNTVTVNLTITSVNDAPVATADSYETNRNTQLTVNAANGVLDNDTDTENDTLTAVLVSDVSHGTLSLSSDGSFTYTPDTDYTGADSFTYKANDGADDGNTVTVSLNVADPTLYSADLSTDVSSDFAASNMTFNVGTGLQVNSGWGTTGTASLTGSETISQADVLLQSTLAVATGNPGGYAEIAVRTSGATDGVYARVYGAWNNAVIELWDAGTLLDSTTVTGLRSQFSTIVVTLQVTGTSASASFYQAAGSGGGQTWSQVSANLSGTVTTSTAAGNIRLAGKSYSSLPTFYDILAEEL